MRPSGTSVTSTSTGFGGRYQLSRSDHQSDRIWVSPMVYDGSRMVGGRACRSPGQCSGWSWTVGSSCDDTVLYDSGDAFCELPAACLRGSLGLFCIASSDWAMPSSLKVIVSISMPNEYQDMCIMPSQARQEGLVQTLTTTSI